MSRRLSHTLIWFQLAKVRLTSLRSHSRGGCPPEPSPKATRRRTSRSPREASAGKPTRRRTICHLESTHNRRRCTPRGTGLWEHQRFGTTGCGSPLTVVDACHRGSTACTSSGPSLTRPATTSALRPICRNDSPHTTWACRPTRRNIVRGVFSCRLSSTPPRRQRSSALCEERLRPRVRAPAFPYDDLVGRRPSPFSSYTPSRSTTSSRFSPWQIEVVHPAERQQAGQSPSSR